MFNFGRDSYLERTSRPVYAIFFLLPFLIFYDLGQYVLDYGVLNQLRIRVAALFWLQYLLKTGFDRKFAWLTPPLMVVVILTAMQITSGKQWRFWIGDILPMTFECTLFAVPLLVLTLFLNTPAGLKDNVDRLDASSIKIQNGLPPNYSSTIENELLILTGEVERKNSSRSMLTNIVIAIGIGIHEEFIFRLVLICILMILFQDILQFDHKESTVLSIIISAVLFSIYFSAEKVYSQRRKENVNVMEGGSGDKSCLFAAISLESCEHRLRSMFSCSLWVLRCESVPYPSDFCPCHSARGI